MTSSVQSAATKSSNRMPKPCAQPIGCAAAALEELVGPGDRAGLGGVEEAEQHEGDGLRHQARRRDQPEHEPEGDDLVPDDRRRVGLREMARRDRAGPPADAASRRRARRRARRRRAAAAASAIDEPGPERAGGARRDRRQAAAEAERDRGAPDARAGSASRAGGPAPASGGLQRAARGSSASSLAQARK